MNHQQKRGLIVLSIALPALFALAILFLTFESGLSIARAQPTETPTLQPPPTVEAVEPTINLDSTPVFTATDYHVYLPTVVYTMQVTEVYTTYDLVAFMVGDGRLYEIQHSSGSQARHQTHVDGQTFYHTKGNELSAEWEELWYTDDFIYRGTDTSPGSEQYYTLRDPGIYGSKWAPRHWRVGDIYERNPHVTFYRKSDCGPTLSGTQLSYLLFEAYHPEYEFQSGITLENVIQLAWIITENGEPEERYFYAENYGLVGWQSVSFGFSYISEIHAPGARPNSVREVIGCLDQSPAELLAPNGRQLLPYWPSDQRR